MIDYNEINEFIIKVFNYYNGKINVINRAVLDINWANLYDSNTVGLSKLPNIVQINPNVIINHYDGDVEDIKLNILCTIIHELYHTDQLINYIFYTSDSNYARLIESACEIETNYYISSHTHEINNVFGLTIKYDRDSNDAFLKYWYIPGVRYQRRYYHDHIFMNIDDICDFSVEASENVYNQLLNSINDRDDILLIINNDIIPICLDKRLITIDEFNNVIRCYKSDLIRRLGCDVKYNTYSKQLIFSIDSEISKLMCVKA